MPEIQATAQDYFWTPAWQAAEREADEDIAAGRVHIFDNAADLIASLHRSRKRTKKKAQESNEE